MPNFFYPTDFAFATPVTKYDTIITVEDKDTLGAAKHHHIECCLNFASSKRPGGGYRSVLDARGPINTQEEDLFRRSNLPNLMDTPECRNFYPLQFLEAIYTNDILVTKDAFLHPCYPFPITLITIPAVVDPQPHQYQLVKNKIERVLDIACAQEQKSLVLGAWGCGVFANDPTVISTHFHDFLKGKFKGAFEQVVFAIPDRNHPNFIIFEETFQ